MNVIVDLDLEIFLPAQMSMSGGDASQTQTTSGKRQYRIDMVKSAIARFASENI